MGDGPISQQRDPQALALSNQYALQEYQLASPLPLESQEAIPCEYGQNPRASADRTSPPAISIRGLTKRYGPLTALNDLNLDIYQGESFGFLGEDVRAKTRPPSVEQKTSSLQ